MHENYTWMLLHVSSLEEISQRFPYVKAASLFALFKLRSVLDSAKNNEANCVRL